MCGVSSINIATNICTGLDYTASRDCLASLRRVHGHRNLHSMASNNVPRRSLHPPSKSNSSTARINQSSKLSNKTWLIDLHLALVALAFSPPAQRTLR